MPGTNEVLSVGYCHYLITNKIFLSLVRYYWMDKYNLKSRRYKYPRVEQVLSFTSFSRFSLHPCYSLSVTVLSRRGFVISSINIWEMLSCLAVHSDPNLDLLHESSIR